MLGPGENPPQVFLRLATSSQAPRKRRTTLVPCLVQVYPHATVDLSRKGREVRLYPMDLQTSIRNSQQKIRSWGLHLSESNRGRSDRYFFLSTQASASSRNVLCFTDLTIERHPLPAGRADFHLAFVTRAVSRDRRWKTAIPLQDDSRNAAFLLILLRLPVWGSHIV